MTEDENCAIADLEMIVAGRDMSGNFLASGDMMQIAKDALAALNRAIDANTYVCGACGHIWTGAKCGQAQNNLSIPVCYPVRKPE